MSEPTLSENRSKLKDLIASIATIRGGLSNITAPPFVLDTKSAVELPSFWAERPAIFVAAAAAEDPTERALLVLKWFLASLRNQQYAGRPPAEGVKKPINAFLGELFLARWDDDQGRDGEGEVGATRLVSEQVSHHPPVTACRVWNEKHGVTAEGYTRQEITFRGSVNIQQIGHATLHLARHDETYLIPLPDIKIKGVLTGNPYPELQGTHHIPSTSGYTSTIDFIGKGGLFSGADRKHSFEARVYRDHDDDGERQANPPIYTVSGHWDTQFVIRDVRRDAEIETFDVTTAPTKPLITDPLAEQDPWESRRAWRGVREALHRGDMQAAADAKARVENGQREMRTADDDGEHWQRLFFEPVAQPDQIAASLARKVGLLFNPDDTVAAWRFRRREWEEGRFSKPYRGDLMPDNSNARAEVVNDDEKVDGVPPPLAGSHLPKSADTRKEGHVPPKKSTTQGGITNTPTTRQRQSTAAAATESLGAETACKFALGHVNGRPTPPSRETPVLPARTEEKNNDVKDMAAQEEAQVEEFLRDRYSSRRR